VIPSDYGVPEGAPAYQILKLLSRHGERPAHIHYFISAPDHQHLTTQINLAGDPYGLSANKSRARNQTVEAREADIRKNKQSRLREWRKGTRPAPDQLKQFMRNLMPEENDVSSAMMRADIAGIWGAFILEECETFKKCGLNHVLLDTLPAFERFPAYWANYRSQAAQIVTA